MPGAPTSSELDLKVYDGLKDFEHHFNNMEFEVRKIASAWMLAMFGAIAFVVRGGLAAGGLMDAAPTLCLIALFGNIGLMTLWSLDQRVYHQLLNAVFRAAIYMEQRQPQLPPLRSLMWLNSGSRGMARYLGLFYAAPMSVAAITGLLAAFRTSAANSGAPGLLIPLAAAAALLPLWVLRDWWALHVRAPALRETLAGPELESRPDSEAIARTIARWTASQDHVAKRSRATPI